MNQERIREWAESTADRLISKRNSAFTETTNRLESAARSLIAEVRREVLEEAAKVCEQVGITPGNHVQRKSANACATALRQLAEREGKA